MSFVIKEVFPEPALDRQYLVGYYETVSSVTQSGFGSSESNIITSQFVRVNSFSSRIKAESYCSFLNGGLSEKDRESIVQAAKDTSRIYEIVNFLGWPVLITTLCAIICAIKIIRL